jgi:hypothetical protein
MQLDISKLLLRLIGFRYCLLQTVLVTITMISQADYSFEYLSIVNILSLIAFDNLIQWMDG